MDMYNLVQTSLEQGVREGCFPSAVAAVGRGADTLCLCAAGEANLDTRYDMASMTKILGPTMVALRALEEGALTLDDTIGRYFPQAPEDKREITVRQLMTHTGGLCPHFLLEEEADSPQDALDAIFRHPLEAKPGEKPLYSCMGYITLGKMLEVACGAPLDALVRDWVFEPLQMRNTGYCPTGDNIAPTEIDAKTGKAWQGVVHDENARFLGGVSANAGIFSDIHDCVRYASMLACGGQGYLAPATLRAAIRNYTPGHDAHRGLGFHLAGLPGSYFGDLFPADSFGHTGFTGTSLAIDPHTGIYVVLLSNRVHPTRNNSKHFRFRRSLHNKIYAALTRTEQ